MAPARDAPITVAATADGGLLYLVTVSPANLPPVRGRDLAAVWDAARHHARGGGWGLARCFRFVDDHGSADLALTDRDARSWADAADAHASLATCYGLSLALRLLALVEVLARSPAAARSLVTVQHGEAELHPALIAAAATTHLNAQARFDLPALLAGRAHPCESLRPPTGARP